MQIKNVKDMYTELQELVSMESQIDIALKRMADAASHPSLKRELLRHRGETKEQRKRLQSILQNHGAKLRAHTDPGDRSAAE
jgi:ferritin-like metal-binding protein YciE